MSDGANTRRSRAGGRRVGRPALISRDLILAAAEELASANPRGAVSILAIAKHLKVTPMAIYTYFASKDDLMQALSGHLLDSLKFHVPSDAAAGKQIELWCYTVRNHFLMHPHLINMLSWEGGRISSAWLNKCRILFDALGGIGLDPEAYAKTVLWIWNSIMVAIQVELHYGPSARRLTATEVAELHPEIQRNVQSVEDFTAQADHHDRFFAFQVERLIESLRRMNQHSANGRPSPGESGPPTSNSW